MPIGPVGVVGGPLGVHGNVCDGVWPGPQGTTGGGVPPFGGVLPPLGGAPVGLHGASFVGCCPAAQSGNEGGAPCSPPVAGVPDGLHGWSFVGCWPAAQSGNLLKSTGVLVPGLHGCAAVGV